MIEFKDVYKSYEVSAKEKIMALKGVTLQIEEGELIVLKGPSGSGKSSMLSLIAALSKPSSGELIVDGKRISKLSDEFASVYRRDNIGFIFQKYNLIAHLSVRENILVPLIPLNLAQDEIQERIESVAHRFHIAHKLDVEVQNLSGGEQQRVAIARSYINAPKIILADEPTANLDKELSQKFIEIVQELKELNTTIVIATHDPLFFDLKFVDREIEVSSGEIFV